MNARLMGLKTLDALLGLLFSEKGRPQCLGDSSFRHDHRALMDFTNRYGYFSPLHPLIARVTEDREGDLKIAQRLFELLALLPDALRPLAIDEACAKVLAYRELEKGHEIALSEAVVYRVDKVLDLWHGMPAYGLLSGARPPLLLFRGTDLSFGTRRGLSSMLSDLDPRGVGLSVFRRARPEIRSWLQQVGGARVLGFSLGGILSAYTCLYERPLVLGATAFNPPGVSRAVLREWQATKPPLEVFVTKGDLVSKVGTLVGNVRELSTDRPMRPLEAHTTLVTAQPFFSLSPVTRA